MRTAILILALAAYAFLTYASAAKPFYPNPPSCTTTCQTNGGQTQCHTRCSGGYN